MDYTVEEKSFQFAVRIAKLCRYVANTKKEYVLTKQLLRAGTSVGANITEAQQAQSHADFVSKLSIALKEACETNYWLRLFRELEFLSNEEFTSIICDCQEIEKMLTSIIKSSKQ